MNFKRFLLFLVAPLAMVMSSCEPDAPVYTNPAISITDASGAAVTALNFAAEGGEQSFTITATRGWNISKTGNWFAISPSSATNESMEEKTTEVKITVVPNDGGARTETIKVVMDKTEESIVVSQSGEGQTALGDVLYYDNFDKTTAAQSGNDWPALDGFVNPTGAAAEGVTYTVANVQARSNSPSNNSHSGYKDEASGNNNAFFRTNGVLTINNINLSAQTSKNYTLTFGCYRSVYEDADNSFKSSEFHVLLSADGEKWTEVAYTRPADEVSSYGTWNKATATFSLKEKPETLSVRFVSDLASSHRLDDVKFFVGGGGAEIDLANGTTSGGNTGGGNTEVDPNAQTITVAQFIENADTNTTYQLTGTIVGPVNTTYGNFDLEDESGKIYVYGLIDGSTGKNLDWAAKGLSEGDIITIQGKYYFYEKTSKHEIVDALYVSHVDGEGGETPEPEQPGEGGGDEPENEGIATVTEDTITMDFFGIKANGSADLTVNGYGDQAHATPSTWYTWNVGDYTFAGIKVCEANGDYAGGYFQQQGNASDAAKQGEIFNTTPIALKTITIVAANKNADYNPSANLYVGTTERPVSGDAVVATTKESTTEGTLTIFTWTYDLSDLNVQYFNFVNNTTGANYYKSFTITYGESSGDNGETPENPEPENPEPENPEPETPVEPENPEPETPVEPENPEPETPVEPETLETLDANAYYVFKQATEFAPGKWYAMVAENNAATANTKNYDRMASTAAIALTDGISLPAACAFGFVSAEGGYTIQQYDMDYLQSTANYDTFNFVATAPESGHIWSVAFANGVATIVNTDTNKSLSYSPNYKNFEANATLNTAPALYELVEVDTNAYLLGTSVSSLSYTADGGEKTFTVTTYGEATLAATSAAEWLTVSAANGVVTIVAAANEGEARTAEVTVTFGEDTATVTVAQAAYVPAGSEITLGESYSYTFEKTTFSANGTVALGNLSWTLAGDGGYWGYDSQNGKGHQFGSSKAAYKSMTLTTEDYIGGVQTIKIKTSGASDIKGTLVVTVGGVQIGNEITLTKTATEYTLEAEAVLSGAIVLTYTQTSSKAIYINSISIN